MHRYNKGANCQYLELLIVCLSLLVSGCMASASAPDQSLFQNQVLQISEGQHDIDLRLQKLQDNLILLEAKLLDQQRMVDELKAVVEGIESAGGGAALAKRAATDGATSTLKSSEGSPTEVYQKAFSDYASGRFQRAVSGFETFIRLYPTNDYVPNALFWLGESYVNLQEPALALDAYGRIADRYPDWGKTPEVLLKSVSILHRQNRMGEAQTLLEILREKYPKSNAAKKSLEDPRFQSESQP